MSGRVSFESEIGERPRPGPRRRVVVKLRDGLGRAPFLPIRHDVRTASVMHPRCGGLTLLEVSVATALLALVVAATVPLVRDACAVAAMPPAPQDDAAFEAAVDRILADPESFDLEEDLPEGRVFDAELYTETISFRLLASGAGGEADGDEAMDEADQPSFMLDSKWLVFESGGLRTWRWLPEGLEREPPPEDDGGRP